MALEELVLCGKAIMACEPKKHFDSRESVRFLEPVPARCGTGKVQTRRYKIG